MASNNRLLGMSYDGSAEVKEVGHKEYPKMLYHKDGSNLVVGNKEEEHSAGLRGYGSIQEARAKQVRRKVKNSDS